LLLSKDEKEFAQVGISRRYRRRPDPTDINDAALVFAAAEHTFVFSTGLSPRVVQSSDGVLPTLVVVLSVVVQAKAPAFDQESLFQLRPT
jgi:hypothetical protein